MQRWFFFLTLMVITSDYAWSKRYDFPYVGRNFTLITPDHHVQDAPLLVLLHGCKQDPELFLKGTGFQKVAEQNDFYILVPEQSLFYNSDHCWNWFFEAQQMRLMNNEMAQVIAAMELVFQQYSIDRNKVFVAGMSAGGAMAHNLTACYPDYFSGSAIHSGLAYKTAENLYEAQTVLTATDQKSPEYLGHGMYNCARMTPYTRLSKVLIIQGDSDPRVNPHHATLIHKTNEVWRDYLDDGRRNDSIRNKVFKKNAHFSSDYDIEQTETRYPGFTERTILVKGLKHAWGGGRAVSENFDPKAPSSNQFILDFFQLKK